MKNNTNIYDIDGELIRKAGDNHHFSLEEAQQKIQYYRNKIDEIKESDNPDNSKIAIYESYIRNLANYAAFEMSKMSKDQIMDLVGKNNLKETSKEEINKALEELNDAEAIKSTDNEVQGTITGDREGGTDRESGDDQAIERSISDVHEEGPRTQSDFLVERADVTNNMDEYVDFEENESNIQ